MIYKYIIYINYYIYILFIPIMFISILLSLVSNTWISMWIIIELRLLRLIILLIFDKSINYELIMKYYLLQSFLSYIFLVNCLGLFTNNYLYRSIIIIDLCILMKLRLVPFHFWYIKILIKLNWNNIYFFSVINKIIPLLILNSLINFNLINLVYLNFLILLISSFFSSVIGLNQVNIKIIIGYSSMIQISWLIILIHFSEVFSLIYFIIYSFICINIFRFFIKININNLNQVRNIKIINIIFFFNIIILISLRGLPPFFGFLLKWITTKLIIDIELRFFFILIFIFNSLIRIFFYLRIIFLILINYYIINKINFKFININIKFNLKYIYLRWFMLILILLYEIN